MRTMIRHFLIVITLAVLCHTAHGLAVMSVDIGSEWMKVAIVSPGVPMEIALNKESQRKTPVAVAFREGERTFGDPAITTAVRFPDKAYLYLLDVLGKKVENPVVKLFQQRFPYYKIEPNAERGTVVFKHPEGDSFTPEELLAMILKQAQQIATNAAGQPVKDAVITVPPYFNQAERYALWVAAQMSGINVLQLINSNTAAALNYGVFRRRDFNDTPTNILFYDMGAGSTVATVVSYQLVKSKETNEVSPQLAVKGVGFDRTLGGLEMQLRLRDHFARVFNSEKKTKSDVFKNNRAMAKLLKEAGRVKKVLSANTDHIAQVESLLDDIDFKCPISRTEFESLCSDLFERVTRPIEVALSSAGMAIDHIDQIILAGSGARVPKVQQLLLEFSKMAELGKSINTDESAALGAVYQAAYLSKGFKVKTFLVKDAAIYPIQVNFQRQYEQADKTTGIKSVRRTLFSRNNVIPQKKAMTFNRLDKDFDFYVSYGELNFLNDFELESLGSLNLTKVGVTGVSEAVAKHSSEKTTDYKGVKAYFKIDENGYFHFETVEALFEKTAEAEEEKPNDLQSTLTKLGNTIGRLFSSSESTAEAETEDKASASGTTNEEPKPEDAKKSNDSKSSNVTEKEKLANETKHDASKQESNGVKKEPKVILVKEPLTAQKIVSELENVSTSYINELIQRLKDFDNHDQAKLVRDQVKNSLESFIVETKHKLYAEEYEQASTDQERETIRSALTEAGDWLEYESEEAATDLFQSKLADLKKLTKNLFDRVKEHQERPEAVKALKDMLNISEIFLNGAQNMTEDEQIFTEVELKTLGNLINDTKKWFTEVEMEQSALPLSVQPKLTVKLLAERLANLDREVKYLLNKARFAKPLKKKKPVEESASKNDTDQKAAMLETVVDIDKSATIESDVKPLDIPATSDTAVEAESKTSTAPVTETPKPDEVKEESHSEL